MTTPGPRRPRCSAIDRRTGSRCTNLGTHRVILGCVHEHMVCGFACASHMVVIREGMSVACSYCLGGPAPHECPTLGREATREEQRRIALARTTAEQRPARDQTEGNP